MMADYIKRTDAVKIAEKYGLANGSVLGRHTGLADCIARDISDLPAADVAEVVRCKYCRHLGAPLSGGCYDCKKYMLPYCRPDDFCSHGEYQTNTGGSNNVAD
jgi:hypothetical protein